ncbi:hypothetical protein BOX15_Mlig013580g1, partial [Macrostomum lignano]
WTELAATNTNIKSEKTLFPIKSVMEGTPSFVEFNRPFHYADAAPASSSVASTSATASAPVLALQETPKATLPRRRANLTAVQRRELERMFELQKYPDYRELELLSRTIGIPYRKVLIWFKNRRAKDRRVRKVDYGPHDFIASSAASAAAAAAAAAASGPSYFQSPKSPMQLQQHYQQHHQHLQQQQQQPQSYFSYYGSTSFQNPQPPGSSYLHQQPGMFASPPTPEFSTASPSNLAPAASFLAPFSHQNSACLASGEWPLPHQSSQSQQPQQHQPRVRYIADFIAENNSSTPMMQSRMP